MVEVNYLTNEKFKLADDIYSLTIAANITRKVSPQIILICIGQCVFTFILQMAVIFAMTAETIVGTDTLSTYSWGGDSFSSRSFTAPLTLMRLLTAALL